MVINSPKVMLFRWAIGDANTCSMSKFSMDGFARFLRMAKTSILSFQKWFPKAKYVVFYNGKNCGFFKESFKRASPHLPQRVEIIDTRDYTHRYHFTPETGVWWKWVPFRYDDERTEIHVDTDIVCLSKPQSLIDQLSTDLNIVLMADRTAFFNKEVCGNLWNHPALTPERIPVNCGIVALKAETTFEDEFYAASRGVNYGANQHSYFLDEQGAFNIGLYDTDIPFALLPRSQNIYATELVERLRSGIKIEICHFIADTKDVFHKIENYIFRHIYDENYTLDDFWLSSKGSLLGSLADGATNIGVSYGI